MSMAIHLSVSYPDAIFSLLSEMSSRLAIVQTVGSVEHAAWARNTLRITSQGSGGRAFATFVKVCRARGLTRSMAAGDVSCQ